MKSKPKPKFKINVPKILAWYCREGKGWSFPDCDKCDKSGKNNFPCFNYKILKEMLTGEDQFWSKGNGAKEIGDVKKIISLAKKCAKHIPMPGK